MLISLVFFLWCCEWLWGELVAITISKGWISVISLRRSFAEMLAKEGEIMIVSCLGWPAKNGVKSDSYNMCHCIEWVPQLERLALRTGNFWEDVKESNTLWAGNCFFPCFETRWWAHCSFSFLDLLFYRIAKQLKTTDNQICFCSVFWAGCRFGELIWVGGKASENYFRGSLKPPAVCRKFVGVGVCESAVANF